MTTAQNKPEVKRRTSTPLQASTKLGLEGLSTAQKMKLVKNRFDRRKLLVIPQAIKDRHPDKHFCFLNYNKLEKNGFWHSSGYRVFKDVGTDAELNADTFSTGMLSGLVRRKEMVAAWMPMEEYNQIQLENQAFREMENIADFFTAKEELKGFGATATLSKNLEDRIAAQDPTV